MNLTQLAKAAVAIVAVATVANTVAHLIVPTGPTWLQGECLVILLLIGIVLAGVAVDWALS
jgi:hypothetical protein